MKIWWTKISCLRSVVCMKHCCVWALEKVNIALDALFVALWLLQAELQVLQTHLKLFLSLQNKMFVLKSSRMNFAPVTAVQTLATQFASVSRETPPCACSGEEASAQSPSCSSPPPVLRFYFEGPLLGKRPGLSPCWPGQGVDPVGKGSDKIHQA